MIVRPAAGIFSILSEVIFGAATTEPRDCEFWERVIEVPVDSEEEEEEEDMDSEVQEVMERILELVGQEEDSEFGAVLVDAPEDDSEQRYSEEESEDNKNSEDKAPDVRSSKEDSEEFENSKDQTLEDQSSNAQESEYVVREEDSEDQAQDIQDSEDHISNKDSEVHAPEDQTPEVENTQEDSEEQSSNAQEPECVVQEEHSEDQAPEVKISRDDSEDYAPEGRHPEVKSSTDNSDAQFAHDSEAKILEEDSEDHAPEFRKSQNDSELNTIIVDAPEDQYSKDSEVSNSEDHASEVLRIEVSNPEDDDSSEDSGVFKQEDQDSDEDSEGPTLHPSPPMNLRISIPTDINFHCDQQDSGLPEEDLDWLIPEVAATSTACSFIKSAQNLRCRKTWADSANLPAVSANFKECVTLVTKKAKRRVRKMAAEVIHQNEPHCFSTSNLDRPFKLLVQKETFLIDADSMSRISPIFSVMCFGKDFEKMDLSREIVDEKSKDIDCFLRAVHDTSTINSTNFALVLRLSNKYQVDTIIEACQQFIMRQHLDVLKPDEILTMLIASYEHHCQKEVVQKLIRRLASEGNTVFTKLRISRFLPAQVYGSVISTSMNLAQVREHETMNGHVLKLERSTKIRWRQSVCEECKAVSECANCEECKKSYCRTHVAAKKCSNDYGLKLLADLKKKIVDFEWND